MHLGKPVSVKMQQVQAKIRLVTDVVVIGPSELVGTLLTVSLLHHRLHQFCAHHCT